MTSKKEREQVEIMRLMDIFRKLSDEKLIWLINQRIYSHSDSANKKAFKALLQQVENINKITNGHYNQVSTKITLKNMILGGTVWRAHRAFKEDAQYRNEIEAIFNECGAIGSP